MQIIINLKSKRKILERLKLSKIDKNFFNKEVENIHYYIEKNKLEKQNLKMSYKKFIKPFDL